MKGLVLTHVGMEDLSASEITSLIDATGIEIAQGRVCFEVQSYESLARLCYYGRTFAKVILVLGEFEAEEMPLPENMPDVKEFLRERVVVNCDRSGDHDFTSFDVQKEWNAHLQEKYGMTIDFKNPQTTLHLLIDEKTCLFGVDFSGIDLGRREYRVFLGTDALKGNIAAALLMLAGYMPKHVLLDPFCRHGIVPIEAALMATNMSPHSFSKEKLACASLPNVTCDFKDEPQEFEGRIIAMDDNFKHVSASKKNAKIAAVNKAITFTRTDMEWLDAKYGKSFVDRIVTLPVQPSRTTSDKKIEKAYHEFFYQAEFILKKSGKVCVCMKRGVELLKAKAEEFNFVLKDERTIWQGKEELTVLVFAKNTQ